MVPGVYVVKGVSGDVGSDCAQAERCCLQDLTSLPLTISHGGEMVLLQSE